MKRIFIGSLSCLLLCVAAAPAVRAEVVNSTESNNQNNTGNSRSLTPDELVTFAMRGELKKQGIPSNNLLLSAYASGKVTAQSLVKAGIAAGKVSPNTLNARGYLNTVADKLQRLNQK
ncbi:hypothetical protein [Brasilonema sp. UFV-L1]|uniref:hypothetical protein n=1 Tax=Brasilonema sp. UFV-L1 TaxID=2234130 RepID=UPI00145F172E|nr:hypothetical protein [Brasilonema sp. UFV-L1]NMG09385.1 hypothetical protein [Brasilonema sp. UFV-L1]